MDLHLGNDGSASKGMRAAEILVSTRGWWPSPWPSSEVCHESDAGLSAWVCAPSLSCRAALSAAALRNFMTARSSSFRLHQLPHRMRFVVISANHRSTRFSQEARVGLKCTTNRLGFPRIYVVSPGIGDHAIQDCLTIIHPTARGHALRVLDKSRTAHAGAKADKDSIPTNTTPPDMAGAQPYSVRVYRSRLQHTLPVRPSRA